MDTEQLSHVPHFAVHPNNNLEIYVSTSTPPRLRKVPSFATEKELSALAATWPSSRLVEIWNRLPGVNGVTKFTDRKTAVQRIWKVLQQRIQDTQKPVRNPNATKGEIILELLKRPSGATLKEIMAATGWQSHSVRSFVSTRSRKLGLNIKSFQRNGERVYRLRQKEGA